jgi:peroxiredoxin Q/BCP
MMRIKTKALSWTMGILTGALGLSLLFSPTGQAEDLKVGTPAPLFQLQTHEGKKFDLRDRKGKWTILYFYPKAETPGCTKQACAFRDSLKKVRELGAEVFGVSADPVDAIARFHEKHHLNFTLLADPKLKVIGEYGTRMPVLSLSKRWTFIVDPELKIRHIERDVDPVKDAERTAAKIRELQAKSPGQV